MVVPVVSGQLVSLLIIMMAGYAMAKLGVVDGRVAKGLTGLLVNVFLPAFAIGSLQIPYSAGNSATMGLSMLGMALIIAVGCAVAGIVCLVLKKKISAGEAGMWMCCCAFTNSVYIGKPLLEALYGSGVHFIIAMTSIVFNVLSFSLGVYLMRLGRGGTGGGIKRFLRALLNPPVVAVVIGILLYFFSIELPSPIMTVLNMCTDTLTPLSMIVIGYSLANMKWKELVTDWRVYVLSALRLLICPLIIYALMRLITGDEMLLSSVFIAGAMPVAATVGVLCEQYENPHSALCAKTIVMTTVLCVGTIPLLMLAMGS